MGEAKAKISKTAEFLLRHPKCIYCGNPATTVDHCPPRCFFAGKHGPEGYEFPACQPCNSGARLDEQALSVLVCIEPQTEMPLERGRQWMKMLTGTVNNSPQLVQEWKDIGRNLHKRILREKYGTLGDEMRRDGVGTLNIGPLSRAAIERFVIKLGKALYYLHTGKILDGVMYVVHISQNEAKMDGGPLDAALKFAPWLAIPTRAKRSLAKQFVYRWGYTPELGSLQAVVRFSSQFMFRLIAMCHDTAESVESEQMARFGEVPIFGRYDCRLSAAE